MKRPDDPVRVLFITSNGFGMGHLMRLLAVALGGADRLSPTMMSMSVALPVVTSMGVPGEYCPGPDRGWMSGLRWNNYLRDRITALAEEVAAEVLVFDGVAPYPGIRMARTRLPDVAFVWMRRGLWRPEVNDEQLAKSAHFDLIIEPGDLAGAADRGPIAGRDDAVRVPPISMLEVVPPEGRIEAAATLGLDPHRPTVLVSLGHGDIAEAGRVVLSTLVEDPAWQIAVTRVATAQEHVPIVDRERIRELPGVYPLVRYLAAFDAVVSAAGYNAVHEFLTAGLPTLIVPNPATPTDDQVARADHLADTGLALSAHLDEPEALTAAVRRLGDPAVRTALTAAIDALDSSARFGGVAATVDAIIDLARHSERAPRPRPRDGSVYRAMELVKARIKNTLGVRGTNMVRRVLRRPPISGPVGRLVVRVVGDAGSLSAGASEATTLLLSERIPAELVKSGPPVEDILAGASPAYHAERRRIVDTYFEVTDWPPERSADPARGEPG